MIKAFLPRIAALALVAALSIGSTAPVKRNWNAVVEVTPTGTHVLGNPQARLKLAEYVSYTCGHCASFEKQADSPLRLAFIAPGTVSVEVRPFVRDPVDLTAAMLTHCGPAQGFFQRHAAFLRSQPRWIEKLAEAGPVERQRWSQGTFAQRMRLIASDFGFYDIAASRGVDRAMANRCLADEAKARALSGMAETAIAEGVRGTPSFMINDELLAGTHDWRALEAQLRARM